MSPCVDAPEASPSPTPAGTARAAPAPRTMRDALGPLPVDEELSTLSDDALGSGAVVGPRRLRAASTSSIERKRSFGSFASERKTASSIAADTRAAGFILRMG